jgi:hypothetical protein
MGVGFFFSSRRVPRGSSPISRILKIGNSVRELIFLFFLYQGIGLDCDFGDGLFVLFNGGLVVLEVID